MICSRCGLSHPCSDFHAVGNDRLPDCVTALVSELSERSQRLRRCELVASNLYEACKAAKEHIFFHGGTIWNSSTHHAYEQLVLAIEAAEEELCPQTTIPG